MPEIKVDYEKLQVCIEKLNNLKKSTESKRKMDATNGLLIHSKGKTFTKMNEFYSQLMKAEDELTQLISATRSALIQAKFGFEKSEEGIINQYFKTRNEVK